MTLTRPPPVVNGNQNDIGVGCDHAFDSVTVVSKGR